MRRVWFGNIERLTEHNPYYRKVLFTNHEQLVLMSLKVGEDIGNEVHKGSDQFFRVEKGSVRFIVNNRQSFKVGAGDAVVIPSGTWHNVQNIGRIPAKLYTIYAPPTHKAGEIDKVKPKGD